jgi:hypothetical protein
VYEAESESEESKEEAKNLDKFLVKWKPVQQDDCVHPDTMQNDKWIAKQAQDCVAKGPGVAC